MCLLKDLRGLCNYLGAGSLLYLDLGYAYHMQCPGELEVHHASSMASLCTRLTFRSTQFHEALDHSDVLYTSLRENWLRVFT